MFSMQCRKNITVEDNKKGMNITSFINIYTNIYTYIICDKNDFNGVINNNYCVLFPTLRIPYLICVPDSGNGR